MSVKGRVRTWAAFRKEDGLRQQANVFSKRQGKATHAVNPALLSSVHERPSAWA